MSGSTVQTRSRVRYPFSPSARLSRDSRANSSPSRRTSSSFGALASQRSSRRKDASSQRSYRHSSTSFSLAGSNLSRPLLGLDLPRARSASRISSSASSGCSPGVDDRSCWSLVRVFPQLQSEAEIQLIWYTELASCRRPAVVHSIRSLLHPLTRRPRVLKVLLFSIVLSPHHLLLPRQRSRP